MPTLGVSGRIAGFFLASRLTPLVALLALAAGVFAIVMTPREEEPQIDVTMANVLVPFPGASAADVEQLVAIPAEQVLAQIQGLEHVWSVSRPGQAIVTVQYKVGVPRSEAVVRLHDAILSHRDWLPPELGVGEPLVKPKGIDDVPIVALTLWTRDPQRSAFDLERVAHAVEVELKRVPGTREVTTIGGPGHVLQVLLDNERLAAHGLAAGDLRRALLAANTSLPAGKLVRGDRSLLVETGGFFESAQDLRSLVVGMHAGQPVYLADVSRVVDGAPPPERYVWHGLGDAAAGAPGDGETWPAVTVEVTKKAGENAVAVARRVEKRMAELRNSVIPEGVEVSVTRDYGRTANDKAKLLIGKLAFATLSVVALVLATLGWREAAIVGTAVVLTLAATLFASWAWGFTLNRVSLFALIFSIGILVDDAIVVVENIHRHRALDPQAPLATLISRAVDEVGGPTILATFTVIAALLPIAFVTGLMGPYMSPIPINASLGMLISLAIAFVVTPWLALRLAPKHAGTHGPSRLDRWLERTFARLLTPFVDAKRGGRRRVLLGAGIVAAIAASVALALVQLVVLKMLPVDNKSEFQVVVDLPAGTSVERTAAVLGEMGAYLASVPEVADLQAYAGAAAPINFNGLVRQYDLRREPEQGDLQVNLVAREARRRKSHEIALDVRPALEAIGARHAAKVKVVEVPPGPPVQSPIVAEIYGPDEAGRHALAERVRGALQATAHVVGVDDSIEEAAARARVRVDQRKAALAGVAVADVVSALRTAVSGDDVTSVHDGQAKYGVPVRLTLPREQQGRLEQVLATTVRSATGTNVPLAELVQVARDEREKTRYRKDLLPVSYVVADVAGGADSPLYGMFAARNAVKALEVPNGGRLDERFISAPSDPYRAYGLKWNGEWQVTYETFRDMGAAYAVGLVLIYFLVVAQFGSYVTPLVIMAPIPLTIIGVMPGHALAGAPFTATSMIGMIALAGIMVRNSILLVDFVNLEVARGVPLAQAAQHAAAARAKPIALTGLAAMAGALFILDDPIFNGLAIALVSGILVSTLLTLVVIPVLYYALNRRSRAPSLPALQPAPPADPPLHAAQQRVDREADDADGDHAAHHDRRADVGLPLDQQVADAARRDDQLGADQRLPAEAGADAQAGDDRRHRSRQQHLGDDPPVPRSEGLRRLDEARLDVPGAAIRVDDARRERAAEDDQHRAADAGSEPERGERHPCDRRDEAQRVEHRRHRGVEDAKPAHHEAERHADRDRQAEAECEPPEARRQMLLQRVADEGCARQRDELLEHLERRWQELRVDETARGGAPPDAEERGKAGDRQREPARPRERARRRGRRHARRHGIARRSSQPSATVITAPVTATAAMPTTIIAGKMSSDAWYSTWPRPAIAPINSPATSVVQHACSDRRRPVKIIGSAPGISTSRTYIARGTPSIRAASIRYGSIARTPL